MGERKAVTKHLAESYRAGDRARKGRILDELVELTGWHRDHARAVLRYALDPPRPRPVRPGRAPVYPRAKRSGRSGHSVYRIYERADLISGTSLLADTEGDSDGRPRATH